TEESARSEFEFPITARHKMMETTTVFDDVFVPWERVFLAGETEFAGPLALGFVEFHRDLLQAAARRRAGGRGAADGRLQRHQPGGARARQADPAHQLRRNVARA